MILERMNFYDPAHKDASMQKAKSRTSKLVKKPASVVRYERKKAFITLTQAAINYGVIADWFENLGPNESSWQINKEALELFGKYEDDLRLAIRTCLQRTRARKKIMSDLIPHHLLDKIVESDS